MSEVLGSILAYLFLAPLINDNVMAALYAIIAGIMIHISVYELIPGAYKEGTLKSVFKVLFNRLWGNDIKSFTDELVNVIIFDGDSMKLKSFLDI